jgi:trk system potassium uptake protein
MRAIFIGASATAIATARMALEQGHEAVIVERDAARVDALSKDLDCSFVVDDGSRPSTLKGLGPRRSDMLCCLTNSDHDNIIAGLVGRALGFERVVVRIDDADLEPICAELGLQDVIIPAREVGQSLVDLLEGRQRPDLLSALGSGWRFWEFVVRDEHAKLLGDLELPGRARVIAVTRDEETQLPEPDMELRAGDYLLLLIHHDALDELTERYG